MDLDSYSEKDGEAEAWISSLVTHGSVWSETSDIVIMTDSKRPRRGLVVVVMTMSRVKFTCVYSPRLRSRWIWGRILDYLGFFFVKDELN